MNQVEESLAQVQSAVYSQPSVPPSHTTLARAEQMQTPHNLESPRSSSHELTNDEHGAATPKAHERRSELKLTDQTNLLPFRKVVSVFAGLAVCVVVSTLDMTLVATALPSLSAEFHAGSVSSFIPSAYLLTSTAFQPLYGRFSDIFGRKAALCVSMGVFMLGNLAAGFSRNISEVIVFRGTFVRILRGSIIHISLCSYSWCWGRWHSIFGSNCHVGRRELKGQVRRNSGSKSE